MSKVLYISNYAQISGYSIAALNNILALDRAGVEVVPRRLCLGGPPNNLPQRILDLERKSSEGCDVVIQHTLPSLFEGSPLRNIGLYASETSSFNASNWASRLNMMDELWAINPQQVLAAKESKVKTPIYVVPHAIDTDRFDRQLQPLNIPYLKDKFCFYTISEFSRRKNFGALIKAFHLEFHRNEPVALVIKSNVPGCSPQDSHQKLSQFAAEIKSGLKLYSSLDRYHQELIITDFLTDEQLLGIHSTCQTYVNTSFGEAWGLGVSDAMGCGNAPIVTNFGGPVSYVDDNSGWVVKTAMEPVFGMQESLPGLYTGKEQWGAVDIAHLRSTMREAYTNKSSRLQKGRNAAKKIREYSLIKVGNQMKELIDG